MTVTNAVFINEQRKFPRYNIELPASIRLKDGVHYLGKTNNISNNGAFLEYSGPSSITNESTGILTLFVEGKVYAEEIKIKCILKPAREGGIGLEFKAMSANDFINFIFLLSSNTPDPQGYFTELKNNPGVTLVPEI
jgi:hypothetical protein